MIQFIHCVCAKRCNAARFADYLAANADKPETFEYPRTERLVTEDGQHFYDS